MEPGEKAGIYIASAIIVLVFLFLLHLCRERKRPRNTSHASNAVVITSEQHYVEQPLASQTVSTPLNVSQPVNQPGTGMYPPQPMPMPMPMPAPGYNTPMNAAYPPPQAPYAALQLPYPPQQQQMPGVGLGMPPLPSQTYMDPPKYDPADEYNRQASFNPHFPGNSNSSCL